MPKTKLTKKEYDSFKNKWIEDTIYSMDREDVDHFATLYFQEDLDHIQDVITIVENFLNPDSTYNPYAPRRTLNET